MPNRTLHHARPFQSLPRAGLRLGYTRAGQRWLSPADWRVVVYTVAGLCVAAVCWTLTSLPTDCAGQCLAAVLP